MSGFTIGEIHTGESPDDFTERTCVALVDKGVSIDRHASYPSFGGLGTYTPAQARELGQLLINAADRWAELNAHVKQAEAEIDATQRSVQRRIKDLLA